MKKTLIMLSLCALFCGCTKDWGLPTTRNYPINGPFTGLEVSNAFQVTVSDQVTDVVVTVGDLAHKNVDVLRDLDLSGASSFTGDLTGDDVEIDLSGASFYRGNVLAKDLDVDLSGASTYSGVVEADKINFELSGASKVTVGGDCQNEVKMDLSGASRLAASDLYVPVVRGNMSGASEADVTCCTSLNVELSGGSTLIYGTISDDCHPDVNCPCSGGSIVRPR